MNNILQTQIMKDIKRDHGQYLLEKMYEKFKLLSLYEHEVLFKIGDVGNKLYILLSGRLGVYMELEECQFELKKINDILPYDQFGENALHNQNCKRNQTIIALEQSTIAYLTRQDYQLIIGKYKSDNLDIKLQLLNKLDCFQTWTIGQFKSFSCYMFLQNFCLNQMVYKENDDSQFLYIVQDGQFEMIKTIQDEKKLLRKRTKRICVLNEGQIFGEESLMRSLEEDPKIQSPLNNYIYIQRYSTVKCMSISGSLFRISRKDIVERCWDEITKLQFLSLLIKLKNFRLKRVNSLQNNQEVNENFTDFENGRKFRNNSTQTQKKITLEPIFTNTYFQKYFEQQQEKSKSSKIVKTKFQIRLNSIDALSNQYNSPKISIQRKASQFHKLLSQRYHKSTNKQDNKQFSFDFPSNNIGYQYYKQFLTSERIKSLHC
ncbi:unnamed protein product [Paramecium primaurelia]|uniref:Cyclic nucleotide-binding domain-containing protein n=1 Tax=Paramecium primaurelia TaxID=5886 RepID=A0A8S1N1P9_PARPR|nr:unnamed protein product [Paramecium primaurelia]